MDNEIPEIKQHNIKPIKDAYYGLATLDRYSKKWKVEECKNIVEAQEKFNLAFDFPKAMWLRVCIIEKVGGEKTILKSFLLDGSARESRIQG